LSMTGYYPDFNLEVSDLPQHGFGTIDNWNGSSNPKLKPAAALTAATGVIFKLSLGTSLYTGVFVDYGLTDLKNDADSLPLIPYDPKATKRTQSNSVLNTGNAGQAIMLSFGLQIRLSFGSSRAKHGDKPKTKSSTHPTSAAASAVPTVVSPQGPVKNNPTVVSPPVAAAVIPPVVTAPVTSAVVTPLPTPDSASASEEASDSPGPIVFGTFGQTSIPESQKPQLDEMAIQLKKDPGLLVKIVGHYCNSITQTEDKSVGEARAKSVARYLQRKGISKKRMAVSAAAESDISDNGEPAANYNNRRVVMELTKHH